VNKELSNLYNKKRIKFWMGLIYEKGNFSSFR
jgi:hypothetical protein